MRRHPRLARARCPGQLAPARSPAGPRSPARRVHEPAARPARGRVSGRACVRGRPRHLDRRRPSCPHVTNYRGPMRVYHERLGVPAVLVAARHGGDRAASAPRSGRAEAGGSRPSSTRSWWARPSRCWCRGAGPASGDQRASCGPAGARLPLAAVGEVQRAGPGADPRQLRGPRADPAAFLLVRPYLRQSRVRRGDRPGDRRSVLAAWLDAGKPTPGQRHQQVAAAGPARATAPWDDRRQDGGAG